MIEITFFLLIKSSDYLIITSSILGKRANLSKFIIGLTIVAIGTSLPELLTAIIGTITTPTKSASFSLGTVIGSNISNILLIFGLLLINSKNFKNKTNKNSKIMIVISTIAIIILLTIKQLTLTIGILMLITYILYIYYNIKKSKKNKIEQTIETDEKLEKQNSYIITLILITSLIILNISAKGVVNSLNNIGTILKIPTSYLTLTIAALATSLPEAVVTIQSAKKKMFDIAIGNIIGSNIANTFFILGTIGLINQFKINLLEYLPSGIFLIIATTLLIYFLQKKTVKKTHGIIFLILYLIYIITTFLN
jgi:cation:H+ antiporter